jgi:hypothetical protein
MPTRILFDSGQEITVSAPEDDVILAVRRDYPNPVRLDNDDGAPLFVNWDHIVLVEDSDGGLT